MYIILTAIGIGLVLSVLTILIVHFLIRPPSTTTQTLAPPIPGGAPHAGAVAPHSGSDGDDDDGNGGHTTSIGDKVWSVVQTLLIAGLVIWGASYCIRSIADALKESKAEDRRAAEYASNPNNRYWVMQEDTSGKWSDYATDVKRSVGLDGRITFTWKGDRVNASCVPGEKGTWNGLTEKGLGFNVISVSDFEVRAIITPKRGYPDEEVRFYRTERVIKKVVE